MSINNLLRTLVEICRDEEKPRRTKAKVQKDKIYFKKDVDVRRLDIIKVIKTKEEFEVINPPYKQINLRTSKVIFIEAKVKRILE